MASEKKVTHTGTCHCGAVKFECATDSQDIIAIDCDCSICSMKGGLNFMVKEANFKLLHGEDSITTYTFNTHQAKHTFCKVCGVQSFYRPRSHPDSYSVNVKCLDQSTVGKIQVLPFHGQQWEENIKALKEKEL